LQVCGGQAPPWVSFSVRRQTPISGEWVAQNAKFSRNATSCYRPKLEPFFFGEFYRRSLIDRQAEWVDIANFISLFPSTPKSLRMINLPADRIGRRWDAGVAGIQVIRSRPPPNLNIP